MPCAVRIAPAAPAMQPRRHGHSTISSAQSCSRNRCHGNTRMPSPVCLGHVLVANDDGLAGTMFPDIGAHRLQIFLAHAAAALDLDGHGALPSEHEIAFQPRFGAPEAHGHVALPKGARVHSSNNRVSRRSKWADSGNCCRSSVDLPVLRGPQRKADCPGGKSIRRVRAY